MTDFRRWTGLARSLAVYRGQPWKVRALARLYASLLAPGDLAFDIGAHAGNRTRALLRAGARVVALEPQAMFHALLARTLPPEVTLLRAAAGPAPGRARLAVSRLHPTVSTLAPGFASRMAADPGFAGVRWDDTEDVAVTTLDTLIAAHGLPRFVKIDVEGYEPQVLAGLGQPVPVVAVEYLPAALDVAHACLDRLAALGPYRFSLVPGETATFALPWTDPAPFRAALATRARDGRPGDIYASLHP